MSKGICTIATWIDFKQELQKYFTPNNTEKEVRVHPHRLKQMGSVYDYINDFIIRILETIDMSDKYSLFYFQDGLKNWAKAELDRHGVQSIDDPIAIVKSLADYFS